MVQRSKESSNSRPRRQNSLYEAYRCVSDPLQVERGSRLVTDTGGGGGLRALLTHFFLDGSSMSGRREGEKEGRGLREMLNLLRWFTRRVNRKAGNFAERKKGNTT